MNSGQHRVNNEWASHLVAQWVDSEVQPSPRMIEQRGWAALVVADGLTWMEAEWLADAISSTSPGTVCGIGFEHQSTPDLVVLTPDLNSVMDFNFKNCWRYAMLTSPDVGFLYFKDEANRFYLLCGPPSFVRQAYRCSWGTARKMYFDYWVDLEHNSEDEKRFLKGVWEKYGSFRTGLQ